MTIGEIITIGTVNPFLMSWLLIKEGGWIIFVFISVVGFAQMWFLWRREKYRVSRKHCLLAIDIPKNNEQGPKAVENFFTQLAGAHGRHTLVEKYLLGKVQDGFSLEIASFGGNVQFLIRTVDRFRDLVEASIYAQYPDAEITEVEDYVYNVPRVFPNDTHKLWGAEFILSNEDYCYPIKTYMDFEHQLSQEFKDPMAAFLGVMSKLQPQEQVWFQIVLTPIDHNTWRKPCETLVKKLAGRKEERKPGFVPGLIEEPARLARESVDQITGAKKIEDAKTKKPEGEAYSIMFRLSPGEIEILKAIQRKTSKIAFDVKIRLVYIATNDEFMVSRVVHPLVGALKQFTALDLNSFKPDLKRTATRANYFFVNSRKKWKTKKILYNYRLRSDYKGRKPCKLNIEELATIYHFPTTFVKAPLVQQTVSKKFEPPMQTPFESAVQAPRNYPASSEITEQEKEGVTTESGEISDEHHPAPPSNLPAA